MDLKIPIKRLQRTARVAAIAALCLAVAGPAWAVKIRIASYNVKFGVGVPGSQEYNAVKSILQRINPDIIAFQEMLETDYDYWITMSAELGYAYSAYGPSYGPLTGSQRLGFLSRFPISSSHEVTEYPGACELTRYPLRAVIEVPGALNPLIMYSVHYKASAGDVNQFRRAIEIRRTRTNLMAYAQSHPLETEWIVCGDFNEDTAFSQEISFSSLPAGLPTDYALGADVLFPQPYKLCPDDLFSEIDMAPITPYREDSSEDGTTWATDSRYDYLVFSEEILNSPYGAPQGEIFDSRLDDGVGGLTKYGAPLNNGASTNASDHLCLFADINMIDGLPCVNPVLILSEIVDHPTDPKANYIEVYNSGTSPLGVTNYAVVVYRDGSIPFTITLTNTLAGGATWVLAANAAIFSSTYGRAANQINTNITLINGNDVCALKNTADTLFDIFGAIGEPDGDTDFTMAWAYPSQVVQRAAGISDPFSTWQTNEWTITNITVATPGTHRACDVADVYYSTHYLAPTAPLTGQTVTIYANIVPNLPASNLAATAYYRLNSDPYTGAAMTLVSNMLWKTTAFNPGAQDADHLQYYIATTFSGPGGASPGLSQTNTYEYPAGAGGGGGTPAAGGEARFNEIQADDDSTDDREFVEIMAPTGQVLTGYFIVHYNGVDSDDGGLWRFTLPEFTVPADGVTDSNGLALGFCVIAQNTNVANFDFLGLSTLQNGPDGLVLYDPASNILDAIAWVGPGDMATNDPGGLTTNGPATDNNYLHVTAADSTTDTTLQAPNNVRGNSGAGWVKLTATPGAINGGQTNAKITFSAIVYGDTDGDSFTDDVDNCPTNSNPIQTDSDGDGQGDACDLDKDGDGIANTVDNCPLNANADQSDRDADGTGDICDYDVDGDGLENDADNCPETYNPMQSDFDGDGLGDSCDLDNDADGVPDASDNCPTTANAGQQDGDLDGVGDACDTDWDNDGYPNAADNCPTNYNPTQADSNTNGVGDACESDIDGDAIPDTIDNCPTNSNASQVDTDHDGIGDACDTCSGALASTNLINESFNGGLPATWVLVTTGSASAYWRFDDPMFRDNHTGGDGLFAIAESENIRRNMDTQLRTPRLNLAGASGIQLNFKTHYDYRAGGAVEVADVDVSAAGTNGPWQNVWRKTTQDVTGPVTVALDVTALLSGSTNAVVRFHYFNASRDYFWEVDDVVLTCTICDATRDTDSDGVLDINDNCPATANAGQQDLDADGAGDACDDDRDGDGVPNAWEDQHGLNSTNAADGTADGDADTATNIEEYRANTDPQSAGNVLAVSVYDATLSAGRVDLVFPSSTGRVYEVMVRDNAAGTNPSWRLSSPAPFHGQDGTTTYSDFSVTNLPAAQPRFYRVKAAVP